MKFAERVVRLQASTAELSRLEQENDPQALASAFVELHAEREEKEIGVPRASSLYDACMRKHVIGTLFHFYEKTFTSIRGNLLFGIGNAVHYWLQNNGAVFGDRRYGWWKCLACGSVRYFGGPPKKPCEQCKASVDATVYAEHALKITKPLTVTGHPDMFFKSEQDRLRVAELKTMEGDAFDKLVAPLIGHVWQIQTYMWACSIDKTLPVEIDKNVGYIFYVTKRGRKNEFPLKCFPVIWDGRLLHRIKDKLESYKLGLTKYPKNLPPPVSECVDKGFTSYQAKNCIALQECMTNYKGRK